MNPISEYICFENSAKQDQLASKKPADQDPPHVKMTGTSKLIR